MADQLSRRRLLADSALAVAAGAAVGQGLVEVAEAAEQESSFRSGWHNDPDRVWLGPEYWANPLQDWRVAGGRAECIHAALNRHVHLLTRELADREGTLEMSVRIGRTEGGLIGGGPGSAGFRIGIQGPLKEYRNSLVFGQGLDAGLTGNGKLFIGDMQDQKEGAFLLNVESIVLRLTCERTADGYVATLLAINADSGNQIGSTGRIVSESLAGGVALIANYGTPPRPGARRAANQAEANAGAGKFWFADWRIAGTKVVAHDDHAFGPILFTQYTMNNGVLKLTAQMPPLGTNDSQNVRLEIDRGGGWIKLADAKIHAQARTATFRVENWDASRDVPCRVVYALKQKGGASQDHAWAGMIRREPVDRPVLNVADVSCNIHAAFPNHEYVRHMQALDPDLIAFTGDQFYESTGGYGVTVSPLEPAILDYLRKWYMHGWTWRDLTRDRPSVSIPDDHDVYQGNIWGESGAPPRRTQEMGGYRMPAEWVNVVHRTQTSHHPAAYDSSTVKQGITQYYGPLTYGGVSFAILADRMYKTAPEGNVPPTGGRGDHVTDPSFDPRSADVPGVQLLGPGQMKFLREWAADWRGAQMKAVISQTIFSAMATTHGGERMRLVADYDTNGWPQSARNEALREIRKAFAFHLAGDQHLPAVVHYGIDEHGDCGVAFAGPAVNVGYPRWWEPEKPGANRKAGDPETIGEFRDHFGHPLTVLAVANGMEKPGGGVLDSLRQKTSGLGIVRFDKERRRITIECWPFLVDPTDPQSKQFPGWPVVIDQMACYGRRPAAHLPKLSFEGLKHPVLQVLDDRGEIVYTLRAAGSEFRPPVFASGRYTVRISDPESGRSREFKDLEATSGNTARLTVSV
jgi:alkaline phosphatase D